MIQKKPKMINLKLFAADIENLQKTKEISGVNSFTEAIRYALRQASK